MKKQLFLMILGLTAGFLLVSCALEQQSYSQFVVQRDDYKFEIKAQGEIIATESIDVRVPNQIRTEYTIKWMIPEFSLVEKDQVVVQFDDVDVVSAKENIELRVAQQEANMVSSVRSGEVARQTIDHETITVEGETNIAETFTEAEEEMREIMSLHEFLDNVENGEYLRQRGEFLMWQRETHDTRTDAELSRLQAEMDSTISELDKQATVLEAMEIKSPAAGAFVYGRTWWGTKIDVGQTVWQGQRVGMIPVRGMVQAQIFVLEVDAVGIELDQPVRLRVHSDLTQEVTGKVVDISNIAASRGLADPTKYFTLSVDIDDIDPDLLRVGSTVEASIITGDLKDALLVPRQAVFSEVDESYIYVLEGGVPVKRMVTIGHKSPTLWEIVDGLKAGEAVSLVKPVTIAQN